MQPHVHRWIAGDLDADARQRLGLQQLERRLHRQRRLHRDDERGGAVTATFVQNAALSVSVTGSGTVTSAPPGISCPSTCSATFGGGTA